ncbi:MAG: ABC transporter substrate-binding protein [Holosporaceae bacterium]|jgi:polar amino acid transport system substrate-binding protein|nr:ABC transporter substrate-binding protein [Holosporaceae bacterium]
MKKALLFLVFSLALQGCKEEQPAQIITFATSAEYPPFEYHENGELMGFDIDLARLIAKELNKKAEFKDMQFSSILLELQDGCVDAAISTISASDERKKNFDFSDIYYNESMSIVFRKDSELNGKEKFRGKKIACQLGTTMQIWLEGNAASAEIVRMDNNNLAIEALKSGHVDGVLIDSSQASHFCKKNSDLGFSFIAIAHSGYAIAFKKGSKLTEEINLAIKNLREKGELDKLEKKWITNVGK